MSSMIGLVSVLLNTACPTLPHHVQATGSGARDVRRQAWAALSVHSLSQAAP